MLVLPLRRQPQARAIAGEPCYKPCIDAAAKEWSAERNGTCKAQRGVTGFSLIWYALTAQTVNTLATLAGSWPTGNCLANAELEWHRAVQRCHGSECGNGSKYPGGAAPKPPP